MSAIKWNAQHNKYQLKGTKHFYLFDYDTCQDVKKQVDKFHDPSPEFIDQWYAKAPRYLKKEITVVEK